MSHTIELGPAFALPLTPFAAPVVRFAERLLGYDALNRLHRSLRGDPAVDVVRRTLDALGVGVEIDPRDRARLPANGGAVIVANLPNGLLDGLVLARVLLETRLDVKMLVARRERRLPELGGLLLELDAKGVDRARNSRVLREALRHVARGGLLVLFPALDHGGSAPRTATHDAPWATFVATIARRAGVPVHPVYLPPARASFLRGQLLRHPRLRRHFEPAALLAGRGQVLRPRVGHALTVESCARFATDHELTDYFRLRTGLLGRGVRTIARSASIPRALEPIAEPVSSESLAAEIDALLALDPAARVASGGGLEAILASAAAIPRVLAEIGRLREITFRAVGEGSGRARDLDRHDADYRHLFLYDRTARRIVGGYRLGLTDELIAHGGASALYTASLFEFDGEFLAHVTPGIELGRSFIVADYQRSYVPLDLLWRGIGSFVARNPRYGRVFGPVSISAGYSGFSRELIVEHVERNQYDFALARAVRPRTPLRRSAARGLGVGLTDAMVADTGEVSRWITELEPDAKAMPVLVREYLKLGGRFVGFNLDASFGDCLDGLVVVDLDRMPDKYRRRYLCNRS